MIFDLGENIEFDLPNEGPTTAIIGAGPVGIYLAHRLVQSGRRVILIEAGGRSANANRNETATRSVGLDYVGHKLGRAFGLGGTSVIWGGQLAEFDVNDFTSWPIKYNEISKWYQQVYSDLAIDPQPVEIYRKKLGAEIRSAGPIERFFTHWLPQQNFSKIFKQSVITNPEIPVVLNATVFQVEFRESQALYVTAAGPGGKKIVIKADDFVFCNGTLEISRFFLSSARRGNVPWAGNSNLGKNYQDHISGRVGTIDLIDEQKFRNYFENAVTKRAVKLHPKLKYGDSFRMEGSLGISGFFSFRSDTQEQLGNLKWLIRAIRSGSQGSNLSTLPQDIYALFRTFLPLTRRYIADRRIMAFFDRSIDYMVQCEQRPMIRSQIRLTDVPHPIAGLYGIEIDWKYDQLAVIQLVQQFANRSDDYLQRERLGRLKIDERLASGDIEFLKSMRDIYHHAGGMCMSEHSEEGVVDQECRVWGTSNIFVCGAAVFPSSSHANTTLTALALAARLAGYLSRRASNDDIL